MSSGKGNFALCRGSQSSPASPVLSRRAYSTLAHAHYSGNVPVLPPIATRTLSSSNLDLTAGHRTFLQEDLSSPQQLFQRVNGLLQRHIGLSTRNLSCPDIVSQHTSLQTAVEEEKRAYGQNGINPNVVDKPTKPQYPPSVHPNVQKLRNNFPDPHSSPSRPPTPDRKYGPTPPGSPKLGHRSPSCIVSQSSVESQSPRLGRRRFVTSLQRSMSEDSEKSDRGFYHSHTTFPKILESDVECKLQGPDSINAHAHSSSKFGVTQHMARLERCPSRLSEDNLKIFDKKEPCLQKSLGSSNESNSGRSKNDKQNVNIEISTKDPPQPQPKLQQERKQDTNLIEKRMYANEIPWVAPEAYRKCTEWLHGLNAAKQQNILEDVNAPPIEWESD